MINASSLPQYLNALTFQQTHCRLPRRWLLRWHGLSWLHRHGLGSQHARHGWEAGPGHGRRHAAWHGTYGAAHRPAHGAAHGAAHWAAHGGAHGARGRHGSHGGNLAAPNISTHRRVLAVPELPVNFLGANCNFIFIKPADWTAKLLSTVIRSWRILSL